MNTGTHRCAAWMALAASALLACGDDASAPHDAAVDAARGDDASADSDGGAEPDAGPGACADVECGSGSCMEADGGPSCICDAGFHAEGLRCVADPCEGDGCPWTVDRWRALFDARWDEADRDDCTERSLSGGANQEHYFLGYCIDGLVSMWRASGDASYLDTTLELIGNTLDDAVLGDEGYRDWPGPAENGGVTFPLWDSFYWRFVATFVRVLDDNPEVRAMGDHQARYEELLEFSQRHIWDKWESRGIGNFYRSRTHMASHWARIGMELYAVTGEAKYLEVFDNVSFGEMPGRPSNLRMQLYPNPEVPRAYTWAMVWGAPEGEDVQDTSHAGAVVSFIENAASQGVHWTDDDVAALTSTLLDAVWVPELDGAYHRYVDGTTPSSQSPHGGPGGTWGRIHEWLVLGRHERAVQARIETHYAETRNTTFFGIQALGIAALNARIASHGSPVH